MGNVFAFAWEENLIIWLQNVLPESVINIIEKFSLFGEEIICVVALGLLYWCIDKQYAKRMGVGIIMAVTLGSMVKNVALRLRPYFGNEKIKLLRLIDKNADAFNIAAQGYSFPSLHSSNVTTVFGTFAIIGKGKIKKFLTALAFILPLLVGLSRIAVGAHYPTDVLAGIIIGVFSLFFFPWLTDKIKNRKIFYLILVLIVLPGFFYCKSDDYFSSAGLIVGYITAVPFEEKYVKFENTKNIFYCALRILGGLVIFLALNTLLKMPFSSEFLNNGSLISHIVRTLRYAVIMFTELGLYPLLFKIIEKRGKKQ